MGMLAGTAVILLILGLMMGSLYLQGRIATKAKRDMQCIVVSDSNLIAEVRTVLSDADIIFSDMLWSPSQSAYNQPGEAQRTPGEIWIQKADIEKVKTLLSLRYEIKETGTALIVQGKTAPASEGSS